MKKYEKVCIIVCLYVFNGARVCTNEFSRTSIGESIGESEGGGKDGVY